MREREGGGWGDQINSNEALKVAIYTTYEHKLYIYIYIRPGQYYR